MKGGRIMNFLENPNAAKDFLTILPKESAAKCAFLMVLAPVATQAFTFLTEAIKNDYHLNLKFGKFELALEKNI